MRAPVRTATNAALGWSAGIAALALAPLVLALIVQARLPDRIVVHWGLFGEPSPPAGRGFLFVLPAVSLLVLGALIFSAYRGRAVVAAAGIWYWLFAGAVGLLLFGAEAYIVLWNLGRPFALQIVFVPLLAILFALTGELCVRVPPNRFIGVRT
ncbi:MAG: DUF1648 domain-containing protein, partial [Candidatus Eiseniibacteriota bacterium]